MAALSSVALSQPAVTVDPESGPPTEKTAVSGTGFAADEAVDLYFYFDASDMTLATTGASPKARAAACTLKFGRPIKADSKYPPEIPSCGREGGGQGRAAGRAGSGGRGKC